MHVCVVYLRTCAYVCVPLCVYVSAHVCVCACVRVYMCVCTCVRMCMHECVCALARVCVYREAVETQASVRMTAPAVK